jgi:hypothetical protein
MPLYFAALILEVFKYQLRIAANSGAHTVCALSYSLSV